MPNFDFRLDERVDLQLPVYAAASTEQHLYDDEETEITASPLTHPEPHVVAVMQTNYIGELPHHMTQKQAQRVVNDDIMLIDMRSVRLELDEDGNPARRFGSLPVPSDKLYLVIASSIFNHTNEHGVAMLGIGDDISIGSQSSAQFMGLSSAAPYHFDMFIDDYAVAHVQNSFAPQGTHVYSGSFAHERLEWTHRRFQIAGGERSFWDRVLSR